VLAVLLVHRVAMAAQALVLLLVLLPVQLLVGDMELVD